MTEAERARLRALYLAEMRRDAWVPGMRCERLADVSRYYDRAQREVLIMWHDFAGADAAAVVRRELAHFRDAGSFTWKVYDGDLPENFRQVLLDAGLHDEREVEDVLMVAGADAMAVPPQLPPGTQIRRLETSAEIYLLAEVWEAVWPKQNGGWVEVLGEALDTEPDRLAILIAMQAGRPVASGYLVLDPRGNFGYLGGGAVTHDQRGQGLYRAIIHARAAVAVAANIRTLAVEASPASRPILERLGFTALSGLRFLSRDRAA